MVLRTPVTIIFIVLGKVYKINVSRIIKNWSELLIHKSLQPIDLQFRTILVNVENFKFFQKAIGNIDNLPGEHTKIRNFKFSNKK